MERFDVDVNNPMYVDPDDTVCYVCGAKLPEESFPGTVEFDGCCSDSCWRGEPVPMVYVRWEGDEEETEVKCTREEYETLKAMVSDNPVEPRECVCGCGLVRGCAAEEVL